MPIYNLSGIANQTGVVEITQAVNDQLMFGWYGVGVLATIGIIMYMGFFFSTADSKKAFAGASFTTFILSIIFRALNLVPDMTFVFTLIILAGSALALFLTDR